jgi:menaquinone-dependent protoporphyrinogen oxidase
VLIVYASSYGQTAKIAAYLATRLEAQGCQVVVANARDVAPPPDAFDGVIVGASVIARGHQPSVRAYIAHNVAKLNEAASAFFSVTASAGSIHERSRAAARDLRDAFLDRVGWRPALRESIAGAVKFTHYNFLLRWYMKRASAMNGGATDTSRDHEYTDWAQVDRFADAFMTAVNWRVQHEFAKPQRTA